jgi:FHS family L-fucose permease-like MFS transporter
MVVGQLIGAAALKAIKPSYVLGFCAAISMILVLFSINSDGQIAVWSMIFVGLFNSVMFAIIFSYRSTG